MKAVTLADATRTNQLLGRALIDAANSVYQRTNTPPWGSRTRLQLAMSEETLDRITATDEVQGQIIPGRRLSFLYMAEVRVDPTIRDGLILVLDPRTMISETVEVR